MKIALFSDIHANLPALQAVLADMDLHNLDQIYCLGDLVGYAPYPNEVVSEIRKRRIPTIAGNHDERIGNGPPEDGSLFHLKEGMKPGAIQQMITHQLISDENRSYLRNLPRHLSLDFQLNGEAIRLLLVHGSPRKINEYLFEEHEEADLLNLMRQTGAHIMAFGHTHKPFHRAVGDPKGGFRHAINIGSVGKPKDGNADACYVLLELGHQTSMKEEKGLKVDFIRVSYEVKSIAQDIEASDFPDVYADMLRKAY